MKGDATWFQVSVLSVQGDLDAETFPRLFRQAEACFDRGQFNLVIDLRQTDSISSGGLIALQTIAARSELHGGKTVFRGVTGKVAHLMDLAGFAARFNIFPDSAAAHA